MTKKDLRVKLILELSKRDITLIEPNVLAGLPICIVDKMLNDLKLQEERVY